MLTVPTPEKEENFCVPELFQQQQAIHEQQHPEATVRILIATLCSVRLTLLIRCPSFSRRVQDDC